MQTKVKNQYGQTVLIDRYTRNYFLSDYLKQMFFTKINPYIEYGFNELKYVKTKSSWKKKFYNNESDDLYFIRTVPSDE